MLGLLFVAAALWAIVQGHSVKRRLAALRAQGYPTSFAELAEMNRLPQGVENAAHTYARAFETFVDPVDDTNALFVQSNDLPPRGVPLPASTVRATEEFLADNQPCLDLLGEAGTIERCRYDWDYTGEMPYVYPALDCARLLASAAILYADRGAGADAVTCIEEGLRLAQSFRNDPALVSYLARAVSTSLSLGALERVLSMMSLTEQQLSEMNGMLLDITVTLDLGPCMVAERCHVIECIKDRSLLDGADGGILRIPGMGGITLSALLDYTEACIEACSLPPAERRARFREIEKEVARLSSLHAVTKTLMPGLERIAVFELRFRGHLDLARCALAVERYRLATGQVPERLATLVPTYLKAVPIDPFDGQPIRYRATEPGYVIYSVNDDARDDGGKEKETSGPNEPFDLCFIVTR